MPQSWDQPGVKWDDTTVGWDGGVVSTAAVCTWSDTVGTWGDLTQGWSGEVGALAYAARPGVYVKNPVHKMTGLQVTIVTQGMPSQPAGSIWLAMKIVVPPGQEASQIDYDLYPAYYPGWGVRSNRGWFTVSAGDDGQTWAGTPAWFSSAGGSVYKRSGNTVYRLLGATEATYSVRARLPDGDWVESDHPTGVPLTVGPALPTDAYRVRPTFVAGVGPRGLSAGTAHDAGSIIKSTLGVWRRSGYPTATFTFSASTITQFLVRSSPVGGKVWGRGCWRQASNFVLFDFGPVADNTQVTSAMCNIVNNYGTEYVGMRVNQISAWGSSFPMSAGMTLTVEAYSLQGAGTVTDPYQQSAQAFAQFTG